MFGKSLITDRAAVIENQSKLISSQGEFNNTENKYSTKEGIRLKNPAFISNVIPNFFQ